MNTVDISACLTDEREHQLLSDLDALKELAGTAMQQSASVSDTVDFQKQQQSAATTCDFQMGDHVYQWCSFALIPAVFQHHGIVMDVYWRDDAVNDGSETSDKSNLSGGEWMLKIADFSNWDDRVTGAETDTSYSAPPSRKKSWMGSSNCKAGGCIRTYDVSAVKNDNNNKWYKVEYQAGFWQRHWQRAGTCTAVPCDAPGLVRARVQFLVEHGAELLPKYNSITANCECVAVWCKTGTWATLQAANWLALTAAGQAKSAVTVASAAAATQVTVPAAGLWGWLGYTTHVSLLSTQPYLLPAIAAYGVITAGAPALWLVRSKQQAKQVTITLNTAFWEQAIDHPDVFVECITFWSALYEPSDVNAPTELSIMSEAQQASEVGAILEEPSAEASTVKEMEPSNEPGQQSLEAPTITSVVLT